MTPTPTSGAADLPEMVSKALREAYNLGQRYWQQADSEYISQHKKADDTRAKFMALVEETCAALAGQATAPQQGAQEPVAWLSPWRADQVTTDYDAYGERGIPLYTAPQPAPDCHHRPPCDECAAIAAQGGK